MRSVQVPDSGSLRDAAEELREASGSVGDWRDRVAAWLEFEANKQDGSMVWVCPDWPELQTPLALTGFTPCPKCRLVRRDS